MDDVAIRPIGPDEFDAFYATDATAFGSPVDPDRKAQERETFEYERSLAVVDADRIVATAAAYSFALAVPGAVVPAAGVTFVAVLPTHRRRGLLTRLMTRQLAEVPEPVAVLWASEAPIYGRFGYGPASRHLLLEARCAAAFVPDAPTDPALELRLVDPVPARADLAAVYDAVWTGRPGHFARPPAWWDGVLLDTERERAGAAPLRGVLAADGSGVRGYALYSTVSAWDEGVANGTVRVRELCARDPAAEATLWRYLLDLDLMRRLTVTLPVDAALVHLLADPRQARLRVNDNLWARLVDVPTALASRRYAADLDVVLDVTDAVRPGNARRWRLTAGAKGAACGPTRDSPDLALPVATLGAAYLGGPRLGALAAAGRVRELRPGALAAASRAFAGDREPYCPEEF